MICRLCLKDSNSSINIFENSSSEEKISDIIGKYFWFKPDKKDSYTNYICNHCWDVVKNFHQLYEEVENNHKTLSSLINPNKNCENEDINIKNECQEASGYIKEEESLESKETEFENDSDLKIENENSQTCFDPITKTEESHTLSTTPQKLPTSKTKIKKKVEYNLKNENGTGEDKEVKTDSKFDEEEKMILDFIKMLCGICAKEERNFSCLKRHFRSVHKQSGYITCCNKKFFKRSWLVDHIGKHINPESFKCSFCGKTCNSRRTLRSHVSRMHKSDPNENYQCGECGKTFKHKDVLSRHSLLHIPEEERKFKCEPCNKTYPVQSLLIQHIRIIHEQRYAGTCDICGKTYTNKEDVNRHRMIVHEGAERRKIKCKICSKEFATKYRYYNHKTEEHGDPDKKINTKCEICDKVSANSEALKRHIEKVHKRIAKFQCTFCDKLFKTDLSLKEHTATHTGQPLYICPHCPKTFTHNANMHHHRKQAHPVEFETDKKWKTAKKQSWTQITSITH